MKKNINDEIKKEEKTFNLLLIAVLTPLIAGFVIIFVYLL
tara:strand:- start:21830 stop:21949 length:120 start_codon:yes stop_codon:yes gene_type:complete